jgi:CheY-like chemotaxis protein
VKTARTSHEALATAAAWRPDAVLLDIGMPELDGYEVARRLRADPTLAPLRLVAVTGYGQPEDRRRALDAGFDDHLVKPAAPDEVERALRVE